MPDHDHADTQLGASLLAGEPAGDGSKDGGRSALPPHGRLATMRGMAWWYRVVEGDDASWTCRLGLHVYDTHDDLAEAVRHCSTLAAGNPPSEVLIHRLDCAIEKVATF